MLGYYNYTVLLTYVGCLCALVGVYSATSGEPALAVLMLMIAGCCDMFDGKIAKTRTRTPEERRFGIQIDSLSDLICFGVLPSVIGYCLGLRSPLQVAVLSLYTLAALIRLAYFNVTEEERQNQTTEVRREYVGLPVTSISLLLPLLYSFRSDLGASFSTVLTVFLAVVGTAFLTPFRVRKPGVKGLFVFLLIGALELIWIVSRGMF